MLQSSTLEFALCIPKGSIHNYSFINMIATGKAEYFTAHLNRPIQDYFTDFSKQNNRLKVPG